MDFDRNRHLSPFAIVPKCRIDIGRNVTAYEAREIRYLITCGLRFVSLMLEALERGLGRFQYVLLPFSDVLTK